MTMSDLPTILRSTFNKYLSEQDFGVHWVFENQLTKIESIPGNFYAEVKVLGPYVFPLYGLDYDIVFAVQADVYQRATTSKHSIYDLPDKAGRVLQALLGPIALPDLSLCIFADRVRMIPRDKVAPPSLLLGTTVIANYTLDLELDR